MELSRRFGDLTKRGAVMHSGQSAATIVYEIDPLRDFRWSSFVEKHPQASVFHTRGWLEALQRTYRYSPIAFTTSSPSEALDNALLCAWVPSWLTGRRLVSLPFSDHCQPLFDSTEHLDMVLDYLRAKSELESCRYVEVRPTSGALRGFHQSSSYYLHRVDLQPSLSEIWRGFDKSCVQRRIRHAQRAKLIGKSGLSEKLLSDFYELLILTRKRHHLPPQPYLWFQNLVESFGDAAEVRVAYTADQTPIAAIFTLRFKDTLVYKYGCSDRRFKNLGAMPLLFWRAIENAKMTGAKELDLGRSNEDNPGLITFKNGWTRNSVRLVYWRFPSAFGTRDLQERWGMPFAKFLFSHLPDRVLTAAGELVYRHIG